MKTTLNIDQELLARAAELTGVSEKTTLVSLGLQALIAREASKRHAALMGAAPKFKAGTRRKTSIKIK